MGVHKAPTLIIQGTRDPYGGGDIAERYRLSPGIRIVHVDADHGYALDAAEWGKVAAIIKGLLA